MASFNSNSSRSPLANLAEQARIWWESSPTSTRVISIGLAILVVLCLGGAIMLASAPDYADLFTGLDPHDAASIAQKLDDAHEKYQLADNDTTVRVPSADKDRLRMEMIRDGLPSKSGSVVGSDWLDKIGMSTTSDVQDQYIRMAQEGELSQTISSMNEVSSAAVHVTAGNSSPFASDDSPPTASIVVGLKPGMTLSSDQTMGIANLVAKAVPGLDIKNVVVVDTDGNQLWDGGEQTGPGGLASNRMIAEKSFSDDLRRQMQSYLDAVLGAHKALVSVHAELDYDQQHSIQTTFGKGAVLSSQETEEKYTGSSGAGAETPAGTAANTGTAPTYNATTGSGGRSGNYDHTSNTTNFSDDKTETETQQAPGGIKKLAVAVLVDSGVPPATVTSIQTYLSTLAGVTQGDTTRVVTVQSVAFSNADAKNEAALMKTQANQQRIQEFIKIGAVALVAIVLLVIFLRSSKSGGGGMMVQGGVARMTGQEQAMFEHDPNMPGLPRPAEREEIEQPMIEEPPTIEQVVEEMPLPPPRPKRKPIIPEIEEHLDMKLESVRDMVKKRPNSVALLMKGWMSDEAEVHTR